MSKEEFLEVLTWYARLVRDPERTIARLCTVSIPTARRWLSGECAPHSAMRPGVVDALRITHRNACSALMKATSEELGESALNFEVERKKPLLKLTGNDIPRGFDHEDVALEEDES